MPAPLFIGDEISAAAWRLAGLRVSIPLPGQEESLVRQGLAEAQLLLMTVAVAQALPLPLLSQALAAYPTLVLIIPSLGKPEEVTSMTNGLRLSWGISP